MLLWALATLSETQSVSGQQPGMAPGQAGKRQQQALRLPSGLLETAMAVAEVQMSTFGAQALSNALWALAKLGRRPADTWLSTALARMEVIMHSCTPQVSTALPPAALQFVTSCCLQLLITLAAACNWLPRRCATWHGRWW